MAMNDVGSHSPIQRNYDRLYHAEKITEPDTDLGSKVPQAEHLKMYPRAYNKILKDTFGYSASLDTVWREEQLDGIDNFACNLGWKIPMTNMGEFETKWIKKRQVIVRPSEFVRESRHSFVHHLTKVYNLKYCTEEQVHQLLDATLNQCWPMHLDRTNMYARLFEHKSPPPWLKEYPRFQMSDIHAKGSHIEWKHFHESK